MTFQRNARDAEGHYLIPARAYEPLRTEPLWAVYQFHRGSYAAVARLTDFIDLAAARIAVDALNGNRGGVEHYFKVFRLAG